MHPCVGAGRMHQLPRAHNRVIQDDRMRGRAGRGLLPFWKLGEEPALRLCGLGDACFQNRPPRPAQPAERCCRSPCPFAFKPVRPFKMRQKFARGAVQHLGCALIIARWFKFERGRQSLRRGNHKAGRVNERKEFKQVQSRYFGIAKPLPDQGGIEQNHRRFSRSRDRFTPSDRPDQAICRRNPDAGMACMKGWIG